MTYFKNHVCYNSVVHVLAGLGIGILITYPYVGIHPVRVGGTLLILALLGHIYPLFVKK